MGKVALIFCLSIAASLTAFFLVLDWEKHKRQQAFSIRAQSHTAAIRAGFDNVGKQQEDMRFLVEYNFNDDSDKHKKPLDFIHMLSPIVTHEPAIIDIHWAILDETNNIQFTYGWIHGEDTDSHPVETTLKPITASFVHEDGILELISPITNTINTISDDALLQGEAAAWLISEWDIETLINQSLKYTPVSAMDIRLSTIKQGKTENVYFHRSRSRTADEKDVHTNIKSINVFTYNGVKIQAEFEAAPKFLKDFPIVLAWQTLVMWLLASLTLTWFLYRRERRRVQLRRIIDNLQDVYYQMDMDGEISFISQSISTFGYTQKEIVGTQMSDHFHKPEAFKALLNDLSESGTKRLHNYHVQINHKDGDALWVSFNAKYIYNQKTKVIGIEGTLNDFTQSKKEQEQLQQTDKLENLGAMAAGIAHNFNNIFAVIVGNASLARLNAQGNDKLNANLREIEKASEEATTICKQMLVYTDQGYHAAKSLNISQSIHSLSEMLSASFSNLADIQFSLEYDIPDTHYADPSLIHQMLIDLIHNAAESYGEEYGIVNVSTGVLHLNDIKLSDCIGSPDQYQDNYIFITVSDQGCGIPKDIQSQIFEPFFSTKFIGRGLGLSAVRGTVLSYNGLISLNTQENEGTTITIFLPVDNKNI